MPRKITARTSAEAFRSKRIAAGFSIPELADLARVDRKTLYRIEDGTHRHPRMSTIRAVAAVLGVSHTDLLEEAA
jgi:transcriptional regulator with XRE-family HTH domain